MASRLLELTDRRSWRLSGSLILIVLTIMLGLVVAQRPLVGIGLSILIAGGFFVLLESRQVPVFLSALAIALAGYAFLGRGFAYFGVPPFFIGEVILMTAVAALLIAVQRWRFDWTISILFLYMIAGLANTVPYLAIHGIDALRDAVLWGYAVFALAVAWLPQRRHFDTLVDTYGRLIPFFIAWIPFGLLVSTLAVRSIPSNPLTGFPVFLLKPGDTAVHLAGISAFVLGGLWLRRTQIRPVLEFTLWPAILFGLVVAGAWNRAALLAGVAGFSVALFLRPTRGAFTMLIAVGLLISSILLIDPEVYIGRGREVSVDQLTTNARSIFEDQQRGDLASTREWRIRWWQSIIDYTFRGPYFWSGKGFGENLADSDGFQVNVDGSLRSPHNAHITVLARMGVPGLMLWITFNLAFAVKMVNAIVATYRRADVRWAAIYVWIFAYWVAMMINAAFDVYLEGPQGGIWFWTVIGLGFAAVRLQGEEDAQTTVSPANSIHK